MNIVSTYTNKGDDVIYESFTCQLDKNTDLIFYIDDEECKITMQDKVSGIVDISGRIDLDGIRSLVRTLRTISSQIERTEKDIKVSYKR